MSTDDLDAQPLEQLLYAWLLNLGTHIGLAVLAVTFVVYVLGLVAPQVPLLHLPDLWSQPIGRYLALTQSPTGWGWLSLLRHSDFAALIGIVIMVGSSLICLLAVIPLYGRRGDKKFVALCLAEVAVMMLAASGWLVRSH